MDITICYAYNTAGLRCMQAAGHDGVHAHAIEWGDDECWDPSMALIPPTVVHLGREQVVEHLVDVPKPSGKCVICAHRMHTGMCGVPDKEDGIPCDCSNGIEE
jgi:hypothetical protein